jgi:uncharacterized metal-binding protein YceD (DUF177 family)
VGGFRQYSIPFRGLKDGTHDFEFVAEDSFFEQFDTSEVKKGLVRIRVEMVKHPQFLELNFNLGGRVTVVCDRCLEPFAMGISHDAELYVRFGESTYEQSDEVFILADSSNELDISQFIFEYIHLALPYQRIHPEIDGHSGCNPEMTRKIEDHTAHSDSETTDPRWDTLKGLINKS